MADRYQVVLKKQIHSSLSSSSTKDVRLIREFWLPFVPFVGLMLSEDASDFYAVVEEVTWKLERETFIAYTPSDEERYKVGSQLDSARPMDEIVADYVAMGWEVDDGTTATTTA